MGLTPIAKSITLKDQAYDAIKNAIYSNLLKPGEPLVEEQLSRSLNISRTPIRSALQVLVFEKLASKDSTGHIFVSHISDKDVKDMTVMRLALEPLAIDLASFPVSTELLDSLNAIYNAQISCVRNVSVDLVRYAELDSEFHIKLSEVCDNELLQETIRNINLTMVRYNILSGTLGSHVDAALDEHRQIIDFLSKEKKDYAILAVKNHISSVSERFFSTN